MSLRAPSLVFQGTGSYAPVRVMTNDDLARLVDTSDEWIVTRTGIRERRIAAENEATSDLAAKAGAAALADAGLGPEEIDLVIVATMTPDMLFPSTACLVQQKLGILRATGFDLSAACSGYLYALDTASALLASGRYRRALVIGAEKVSSILDWRDRTTCVLFGDGAGASVLTTSEKPGVGLLGTRLHSDGSGWEVLHLPAGGSRQPATAQSLAEGRHFLKMRGKEVFKMAVRVMEESAREILAEHGLRAHEIGCVIPHQANLRILEALAERLEIPMEKFFVNLDRYGNTSAASVPVAIDEARRAGRLRAGEVSLLVAFGAGLTWGSALIRW